jgi:hypothetical protein
VRISLCVLCETRVASACLHFYSSETKHKTSETARTSKNSHIFAQISNESQIFTQMTIFSHIEHISHKYPMKVKFSYEWTYFHTLSIFYIIILLLSVMVLSFWNSWLFHGGHCASTEFHWAMVFLAWSSRWRKEEYHQIDQTFPHQRHSRLRRFIIFQV